MPTAIPQHTPKPKGLEVKPPDAPAVTVEEARPNLGFELQAYSLQVIDAYTGKHPGLYGWYVSVFYSVDEQQTAWISFVWAVTKVNTIVVSSPVRIERAQFSRRDVRTAIERAIVEVNQAAETAS